MSTLTTPEVSEKAHIFNVGCEIGKTLDVKKFYLIFEEAKNILVPLVPWLDRPTKERWAGEVLPVEIRNKRIMSLFYHSVSEETLSIEIQRSGKWLVKIISGGKLSYHEIDSLGLVELMLEKTKNLLLRLSLNADKEAKDQFLEKLPFLETMTIYNGMLVVLSMCFNNITNTLNEREERLRIMRERANLLKDFASALDPLVISGQSRTIKTHSIWSLNSGGRGGSSRYTGDYLSESQIKNIWDVISKKPGHIWGSTYTQEVHEFSFGSMKYFLHSMSNLVQDIFKAERENKTTVESLSGYNYGRLPFSEDELENIRKLSTSIIG